MEENSENRGAARVRKDLGRGHDAVMDVLRRCENFEDIRRSGILFHGTCEDLQGDLHGGGYDGVFWTADQPNVAQAYIPRAGSSAFLSRPSEYERDDRIRPSKDTKGLVMSWAMQRAGVTSIDELDVTSDGWKAHSYTVPRNWPTYGELDVYIQSLGYVANEQSGIYKVSLGRDAEGDVAMPADWKMPGHLVIALPRDIEVVSAP